MQEEKKKKEAGRQEIKRAEDGDKYKLPGSICDIQSNHSEHHLTESAAPNLLSLDGSKCGPSVDSVVVDCSKIYDVRCKVCPHPDRKNIESRFLLDWEPLLEIHKAYTDDFSYPSLYRHACHAGLFELRRHNVEGFLNRVVEKSAGARCSAKDGILAAKIILELQKKIGGESGGKYVFQAFLQQIKNLRIDGAVRETSREKIRQSIQGARP